MLHGMSQPFRIHIARMYMLCYLLMVAAEAVAAAAAATAAAASAPSSASIQ